MYYNNGSASSQQNPTAVWDVNYVMFQHLHETSGTHLDATTNSHDGTPQNGVLQNVTGIVDGADEFDGSNDRIDIADSATST